MKEMIRDILLLARPYQWVKNSFVFAGLLFAKDWGNLSLALTVLEAALAFSLVASAVYVFNDLVDAGRDRRHSVKRSRPLAAGRISRGQALALLSLLVLGGLFLGWRASGNVLLVLGAYIFLQVLYSLRLREVVILDVFVIASGFLLRVLAGTSGVGIPPSKWLILCTIMLSLFLGFIKRKSELMAHSSGSLTRKVLEHYSPEFLDKAITITGAATLITYALYTVDRQTVEVHHTEALIYTVPVVTYGLYRYLLLLEKHALGQDPALDIFSDMHLLVTGFIWVLMVALILGH